MVSGLYLKGSASQMRMLSFAQSLSMVCKFQVLLGSFASLPVHPGAPFFFFFFDTLKKNHLFGCARS